MMGHCGAWPGNPAPNDLGYWMPAFAGMTVTWPN